jgi:hypothetical protein
MDFQECIRLVLLDFDAVSKVCELEWVMAGAAVDAKPKHSFTGGRNGNYTSRGVAVLRDDRTRITPRALLTRPHTDDAT